MNPSFYLVVGSGKTGLSIARYLYRKKRQFVIFDTRSQIPQLAELRSEFPDVPIYNEAFPLSLLSQLTDIIVSPGLALDLPFLQEARARGISIYGDIECFAREVKAPVVAITGTNGKSTVTTLVGQMAEAAGYKVAVAGNIGTPVLDMLYDEHHYDLWVLELSSFQLELTYSLAPLAATILNVSPDHLDRHHSMEAYTQAKHRIYQQAQVLLFNRDDPATRPGNNATTLSFGQGLAPNPSDWGLFTDENATYLSKGAECWLPTNALLIKGIHNWLNALAASALASTAGVSPAVITQILKTFSGLPHRCQWVRELDEVTWINDSKGTNIGATISAINGIGGAMQGRIVLIAGGQGKGADFKDLAKPLQEFVRCMILIGEDAQKMEEALGSAVQIRRAHSLDDAVSMARAQAKAGDVVLLSPACASLDMFRDFNHRGEQFMSLVSGL